MGLRDDLAADYAAAIEDYDQTFEFGGQVFPCVRMTAPAAMPFASGGEWAQTSERITVSLPLTDTQGNVVDVCPEIGDLVDDNALQIQKIDANVGTLTLWVGSPMPAPGGQY